MNISLLLFQYTLTSAISYSLTTVEVFLHNVINEIDLLCLFLGLLLNIIVELDIANSYTERYRPLNLHEEVILESDVDVAYVVLNPSEKFDQQSQ